VSDGPRNHACARLECRRMARSGCRFCSRSCGMKATRARQTPEHKHRIAMAGRQAQRKDEIERLLARVRLLANTDRGRILLAYSLGKRAAKSERYRQSRAA
jgi:hypothetical protein